MKKVTCILSVLTLTSLLAMAEEGGKRRPGGGKGGPEGRRPLPAEVFKKLDADSDGKLSLDEFKESRQAKANPDKAEEIFKKIDADSDGSVTLEELKAHRPPPGPGRGRGKGKPEAKPEGEAK